MTVLAATAPTRHRVARPLITPKEVSFYQEHSYLLHRSLPNVARSGFRRSLVNHYCSAETFLPRLPPQPNVGIAMHDHRDIVLIAGKDPYAYRGTTDVIYPHLRPDREEGCRWPARDDA